MSKKYRLVRTDPGVLDLTQVTDDRGKPVLLKKIGDFAVVTKATTEHPMVKRFVGVGLKIEEISLAPASPAAPQARVEPPKAKPESPTKKESPKKAGYETPFSKPADVMTKETVEVTETPRPDDTDKKSKKSKAAKPSRK